MAIEPDSHAQLAECIEAYVLVRRAGFDVVEWGMRTPHPWIRRQSTLPPPNAGVVARWVITDLELVRWNVPISLPVVPSAERYYGADLIVQVDPRGQVLIGGKALDKDALDSTLALAASSSEQVIVADNGTQRRWSELRVLLRIDKDTEWAAVREVLRALRRRAIYRTEFAATRTADLSTGKDEARALDVVRNPVAPLPEDFHIGQLLAYARIRALSPKMLSLRLLAGDDRITMRYGEQSVRTIGELRSAVGADLRHDAEYDVQISAEPSVPFKWILRATGMFNQFGISTVFFELD